MGESIENFWEKPLAELNENEWELLCDGCGRCCLKKFVNVDNDETVYTRIICRYYDESLHHCTCYEDRVNKVPDCLNVKTMNIQLSNWMPDTCAYRLRFENKPLYSWHPLIAGSRSQMEDEDIAVLGKVISEEYVHPDGFEEHVIRWITT
ncbi:MAG: hypothetical protein COA96_17300 [SAR86 cluster bacterium]|uniref:YcgN family cysteine cluster protein n=1 Tax=SAR86 cluster bacterium TaxID=2030880 RepID=A0A2A5AFU3_9GAMM|nr:MAG: hypothetical protein COA96_17300 [SAR86 cluster bacterium]